MTSGTIGTMTTAELRAAVDRVAMMWKWPRNSQEIAKALKITEPDALRLLNIARNEGLL